MARSVLSLSEVALGKFTTQALKDLLQQFGSVVKFEFPTDPRTGLVIGNGTAEFSADEEAAVACQALDGFPVGPGVLKAAQLSAEESIRMLTGSAQQNSAAAVTGVVKSFAAPGANGAPDSAVGPLNLSLPAKHPTLAERVPGSVSARVFSDPYMAAQVKIGRLIGSTPSVVVQLLNAITIEDLASDEEYSALVAEIEMEASKFGRVEQVVIPRPAMFSSTGTESTRNETTNPESASLHDVQAPSHSGGGLSDASHSKQPPWQHGYGKIFVVFKDLISARKFKADMNGRLFDSKRVMCAAFYPFDRFANGLYTLHGYVGNQSSLVT